MWLFTDVCCFSIFISFAGVEKIPGGGDAGPEIFLRVSNFVKDVPISMLSDDDFTEVIIHLNP